MTEPLLTRFLRPAGARPAHLERVLADAVEATSEGASTRDRSIDLGAWSLQRAAILLAADTSLDPGEIRARIRDDLLLEMSRVPIDVGELAGDLDDDPGVLRDRIEGDRPLALDEYAHVRAILSDRRKP
ncbi:MAG: DUF5791 family protein [Halodesulfurarchaeum sp.]